MSNKKRQNNNQHGPKNFSLRAITPMTENQRATFEAYEDGYDIVLNGVPGSGKTFVALYLALDEMQNSNAYDRIIIIRSAVASRDIGFLPGSAKEKMRVYEEPYQNIVNELYERGDGWDLLKTKKSIDFMTTSFLRGLTFDNAIVIVDEMQNCSYEELRTIITRVGENTRLIFSGDYRQSDLKNDREKEGILTFTRILSKIADIKTIEFGIEDIVRSDLVKKFLIAEIEDKEEQRY